MSTLGELVVKIGADTRNLNKSLGRVQSNLRGMTRNFQALGQNITRNVTLPLAAFGAAAVKSAADLETLETSFISLTGGAEQAAKMVAQLNDFTAETPFQLEAVGKAARQLIASGTGIEDVNTQLQFLGDIAATSGSSIDEIAAIFAKVKAKGKVELENLNQLAERGIPIFTALSEATGLLPSELGAGRVSVEQFTKTLQGFAEEGGFANGAMERLSQTAAGKFSTALDNLKLAGAALGEQLLPAVTAVLDKVTQLSQSFVKTNQSTRGLIIEFGLLAAAVGPALIFLPQIIAHLANMKLAFQTLRIAMMANPFILVATALTTLVGAVVLFRNRTHDAVAANDTFIASLKDLDKQAQINEAKARLRELESEKRKLKEAQAIEMQAQAVGSLGDKFEKQIARGNVHKYTEQIGALDEQMRDLAKRIQTMHKSEEDTPRVYKASEAAASDYADSLGHLFSKLEQVQVKTQAANMTMGQFFSMLENVQVQTDKVAQAGRSMGETLADSLGNAIGQAQSFGSMMLEVARSVIVAYLAQTKAKVLQNSAEGASGTGPAYPFVMAGLLTAGMALMNRVQIPALAKGGLAYGPTMAMVGDNRNAAIDPEVVAPLSKLKDMMGGNRVEVFGRIKGDDIFLSNTRSGTTRNRLA